MDYSSLVLLIAIHIIFDFLLQTRDIATNKSSNIKYLIPHLVILFMGLMIYTKLSGRYSPNQAMLFVCWNIFLHGVIDWNIWRLYKWTVYKRTKGEAGYDYKYWEDGMFYDFIAYDQGLHALCYLGLDWIVRSYVV